MKQLIKDKGKVPKIFFRLVKVEKVVAEKLRRSTGSRVKSEPKRNCAQRDNWKLAEFKVPVAGNFAPTTFHPEID